MPRKLTAAVSTRGQHLSQIELGFEWVVSEAPAEYELEAQTFAPEYEEIESPVQLKEPQRVASDLEAIDWAFTKDNTRFLTHDLHPYPAKFIPQIPGHLIARLSLRGELVLDPFGGSGTTALEAIRLGRRAISLDANAVGTLIGRAKTLSLDRSAATDLHAIRSVLATLIANLPPAEQLCTENQSYIPEIPNIEKWFPLTSRGELAAIRSRIARIENEKARVVALLALSRIVLAVSFQDSETRYSSKPREIPPGEALKRYLIALETIVRSVVRTQPVLRYGVADFRTTDARQLTNEFYKSDSVDLVVTSPPYGNSTDYHLYHRFRLLWLGDDPGQLARVEIGSHLRHQKESSGFDAYLIEMGQAFTGLYRILRPGRYAVLVVGDAIYKGITHRGAESLNEVAKRAGFETVCIIGRRIHDTKRSFLAAGRRATTEKILVLRKPLRNVSVYLKSAPYRLWPYESVLRLREIETTLGFTTPQKASPKFSLELDPYTITQARKLVFTHSIGWSLSDFEPTWQAIIENGFADQPSARKDPKYVTHGLHPYKGKFYPQLAKALINLSGVIAGNICDPFCGSGTTLLEGYLNGHRTFGCDMHPLAAKIARAKLGILEVNPDLVREAVGTLASRLEQVPRTVPPAREQLNERCLDEIQRWFPSPVVDKINWLLRSIRNTGAGVLRDFFEVILSSILRDVSHQDPSDLRIRRRKKLIEDADVFGLYLNALETQYARIQRFWTIRGWSPSRFIPGKVVEGDSRQESTFQRLGLCESSIDLILTSPPYATALPYIDTDRLSLLVLFGMDGSIRRPIEQCLVGSREIATSERRRLEAVLAGRPGRLPQKLATYLIDLHDRVSRANVGFRRTNMPALLLRFFQDMDSVLHNCFSLLRPGHEAMIVIGDNRIRVNGDYERIATTEFLQEIAATRGFTLLERIDISVTTENLIHIKNAITENVVLRLKRPVGSGR